MRKGEIAIIIFGIVVVVVVVVWLIISSNSSSSSSSGGSGGGSGTSNLGDKCGKPEDCSSKICGKDSKTCLAGCKDSFDCTKQLPFDRFCDTAGPVSSIMVSGVNISNGPLNNKSIIANFALNGKGSGCVGTVKVTGGFGGGLGDLIITSPGNNYNSYGNSLSFSGLLTDMTITVYPSDMSVLIQNTGQLGTCIDKNKS